MPKQHTVKLGEHVARIAEQHGFRTYRIVWDHPANAALRQQRQNPNVLYPADQVQIPDKQAKRESRPAGVEQAEKVAVGQIKEAFRNNKDDIAAIIIEPIQGEGGDNHFRREFFVQLRQLADENEAMLIFDEVQTGVGLTGKMWAHEHFVEPNMISFGKKTQVCGFMAGKRIEEVKDNVFAVASRINSTWGAHIVDMLRATVASPVR